MINKIRIITYTNKRKNTPQKLTPKPVIFIGQQSNFTNIWVYAWKTPTLHSCNPFFLLPRAWNN